MSKGNFRRSLFFWIDKLHISRKERFAVSVLFCAIVVLLGLQILIKEQVVPPPDNHAQILEEFERKSALVRQKESEIEARYSPSESTLVATKSLNLDRQIEPVNINTASQEELESLPGIGKSYAQRIIEYRETIGEFTSVEELVNVKGIGEKTLEKLKPFLELEIRNTQIIDSSAN